MILDSQTSYALKVDTYESKELSKQKTSSLGIIFVLNLFDSLKKVVETSPIRTFSLVFYGDETSNFSAKQEWWTPWSAYYKSIITCKNNS